MKHKCKHTANLHFMHWNLIVLSLWLAAHTKDCKRPLQLLFNVLFEIASFDWLGPPRGVG